MPAESGIHASPGIASTLVAWIPAFAGMTLVGAEKSTLSRKDVMRPSLQQAVVGVESRVRRIEPHMGGLER